MNIKILATFEPLSSGWGSTFWICTLIALAAGAGLWFLLTGKPKAWTQNVRLLVAMLAFFAMMILGGTAFFQGWAQLKKGPVVFYEEQFKTTDGTTKYVDIKMIKRERIEQTSPFNSAIQTGETLWVLLIEDEDGTVHFLPGSDYPIDEIADKLNEIIADIKGTSEQAG